MKYKFLKDGQIIETEKEKWCWEAYYTDGTILKQFDDNGYFHQFNEIDQTKLHIFKMVGDGPTKTIIFKPEMKLIHYYKRYVLNFGLENELHFTCYCFGYEIKVKGKVVKNILVITPTGETVLTDNPDIINFN